MHSSSLQLVVRFVVSRWLKPKRSEYRFTLPAKDAKRILKRAGLDPRRRRSRVQLSTVHGAVWAISGGILAGPTFLIAIFYLLSPMFYADAAGWGMYGNGSFGDEMFGLVGAICLLPLLWNVIASRLGALLRPSEPPSTSGRSLSRKAGKRGSSPSVRLKARI